MFVVLEVCELCCAFMKLNEDRGRASACSRRGDRSEGVRGANVCEGAQV